MSIKQTQSGLYVVQDESKVDVHALHHELATLVMRFEQPHGDRTYVKDGKSVFVRIQPGEDYKPEWHQLKGWEPTNNFNQMGLCLHALLGFDEQLNRRVLRSTVMFEMLALRPAELGDFCNEEDPYGQKEFLFGAAFQYPKLFGVALVNAKRQSILQEKLYPSMTKTGRISMNRDVEDAN